MNLIRNPWDRLLSEYLRKRTYDDNRFIDVSQLDFQDFVKALYNRVEKGLLSSNKHESNSHFIPQYDYIFDRSGEKFVDYIGRYETLERDMNLIAKRIGLNPRTSIGSHSTEHDSYTEYYTDKTRDLVSILHLQVILPVLEL